MRTSAAEHQRRKDLYDAQKTDQEMSAICFVCVNAIRYWRNNQNPPLPPNTHKSEKLDARAQLYEQGLDDREIAKQQQCSKMAVRDWRKKRGLLQNKHKEEGKCCANN